MKRWLNWVQLGVGLAIGGCGGSAPPPAAAGPTKPCSPAPLELQVTGTTRLNSLSAGDGRPVQLRVYQLKSDVKLRTASFEDVWQNDAKALEGDVVSSDQQTIFPGDKKTLTVTPKPEASYLALVALFREPQGKDWFLTYEITPTKQEPPCTKKPAPIPVWLDRMQIQDGAGRAADEAEPSPNGDGGS
jgi:type VI secretion system protein VasD